jgi:hypothetical protein
MDARGSANTETPEMGNEDGQAGMIWIFERKSKSGERGYPKFKKCNWKDWQTGQHGQRLNAQHAEHSRCSCHKLLVMWQVPAGLLDADAQGPQVTSER